jgi:subtilisin family serine protease
MSKNAFSFYQFLFILGGIFLSSSMNPVFSQNQQDLQNILKTTNGSELQKYSRNLKLKAERNRFQAYEQAGKKGWMIKKKWDDGTYAELKELGRNGIPVYFLTNNLNAAKTVSTNKVWNGGSAGLNLSGSGITLREWDESGVRTSHQELTGRVTQGDAGTYFATHSTHVAGTMLASGIVSSAHGMANQAFLRAFDWWNDYAEMASEAGNGALLSNSSYIFITGWYNNGASWYWYGDPVISPLEDYEFGFYSSDAATVDSITYNAPYYLPCKATGNDRGEGPSVQPVSHYVYDGSNWVLSTVTRNLDGMPTGFDCIANGFGVSKNVLSVGAVYGIPGGYTSPTDVVLASFSGTGPTDDGRIKPDIVADGISLYSTGSAGDNAYVTMSGTSMATPNTTGSLALLQEHYHNLHDSYMRAASLKGVAIHTTDEAGSYPGPDYKYGWGLLNTAKAASVISNNSTALLKELTLLNGTTYSINIKSNGSEPLRATICWTDPPGNPPQAFLNPQTIMLVNDLDLRIDGNTYKPWILDPANLSSAATTGDNFRDNVEQILVMNPGNSCHTLTVTHKGLLTGGSQVFSLIVSGITNYPVFAPGLINGNQIICANVSPSLFTGIPPSGGSSPYSFQWQNSSDSLNFFNINGATELNYQPGPLTTTTYYRQIQSSQGSCNSAYTNIIKVKVNPLPVPSITGNTNLCVNSGNYSYETVPGMTNYFWTTSSGGNIISGAGTNIIQVHWSLSGNQSVTLSYTNTAGCLPVTPAVLPVIVNPLPGAALSITGTQTVCSGTTDILYSVSPVADAITYIWTILPGCTIQSGQLSDSIWLNFSNSAISGNIQVYGNNLCGDGLPSPDYPVTVISAPPTPVIIQQGDSLISNAPEGNQWFNETGIINGATSSIYKPITDGLYRVTVSLDGCSSQSEWFDFVATRIDHKSTSAFNIYPTPADQIIHLNLQLSKPCNIKVDLINTIGTIIKSMTLVNCPAGKFSPTLQSYDVKEGTYFLRILAGAENYFQKVIILRESGHQ